MRVIGGAIDQIRANQIGDFLRELHWCKNPPAERGVARIGERQIGLHGGIAIPRREHAEIVRQILDRDLGAQLVETKPFRQALRQRARPVPPETPPPPRKPSSYPKNHPYLS